MQFTIGSNFISVLQVCMRFHLFFISSYFFLLDLQAPVRANVKKGLFTSLRGALDDARFHNHKVGDAFY